MSDAPVKTWAGIEGQPPMPVRRLHHFDACVRPGPSAEVTHGQSASVDDAFECAEGNYGNAPAGTESFDGWNQSSKASLALRMLGRLA